MCIFSKMKAISTYLTSFNALATFRFIFGGLYYDLSDSTTVRYSAKMYSIAYISLNLIYFPHYSELNEWTMHLFVELIECTSYGLLSHVIIERNEPNSFNSSYIPSFIVSIMIAARSFYVTLLWKTGSFSWMHLLIFCLRYVPCLTGRLNAVFAYDVYRKRVKSLMNSLELGLANENSPDEEKFAHIRAFSDDYRELSDNFFSANDPRKVQIRCGFVFDFLKSMCLVYFTLSGKEFVIQNWYLAAIRAFELMLSIFTICLPGILSEITNDHIDAAKHVILDQLFTYKGDNLRSEIHTAVKYLDAQKTRYTLWNDLPLNLSFVFAFINICAAYVIAIMQFKY